MPKTKMKASNLIAIHKIIAIQSNLIIAIQNLQQDCKSRH